MKALIKFKVGKTEETAVKQTLRFFAEKTKNLSDVGTKQLLPSSD
jgi:hypothetical protein